jgi:hypothetical protein
VRRRRRRRRRRVCAERELFAAAAGTYCSVGTSMAAETAAIFGAACLF